MDLRAGQELELVFGRGVNDRHLDYAGLLAGLVDRELLGELREAVTPFHTALHSVLDRLHVGAIGQVRGVEAAVHAVDDLHAHDEHEHADDADERGARDGLPDLGARGVVGRERVHLSLTRPAATPMVGLELVDRLGPALLARPVAHGTAARRVAGAHGVDNAGIIKL